MRIRAIVISALVALALAASELAAHAATVLSWYNM